MSYFLWPITVLVSFLAGMWFKARLVRREREAMKTAMWGQFAELGELKVTEKVK